MPALLKSMVRTCGTTADLAEQVCSQGCLVVRDNVKRKQSNPAKNDASRDTLHGCRKRRWRIFQHSVREDVPHDALGQGDRSWMDRT